MFNIGGSEMIALAILALLVFGPEGLPGVIKKVVRTMHALRTAASDFQTEVKNALEEEGKRLEDEKRRVQQPAASLPDKVLAEASPTVPEADIAEGRSVESTPETETEAVTEVQPEEQTESPTEIQAETAFEPQVGLELRDQPVMAQDDLDAAEETAQGLSQNPNIETAQEETADEAMEQMPEEPDDDGPGVPMNRPLRSVEA